MSHTTPTNAVQRCPLCSAPVGIHDGHQLVVPSDWRIIYSLELPGHGYVQHTYEDVEGLPHVIWTRV